MGVQLRQRLLLLFALFITANTVFAQTPMAESETSSWSTVLGSTAPGGGRYTTTFWLATDMRSVSCKNH